ncbi:uncharacterized protein [Solanum lycopersicum]|uniref:uncharacterized protein n=1 Tax=Solanum lycopersicum TaxID=4081 RepID=UPI000532DA8D|nr:uncharacterized protein LOC104648761 [Solanum lycopersicum]
MGDIEIEKAELASYQLKEVLQAWCKIRQDSRALGGGLITWELFKIAFLERFFPREMREAKFEEFINLKHGSMTIREYSLKFIKLSRYAPSLVSNIRDEMSRLRTVGRRGESMRSGGLILLTRQVPAVVVEGALSEFVNSPDFKKGHQILGNRYSQRSATPRGGKREQKKGNRGDVKLPRNKYGKCGRIHSGECRLGTNSCFGCRKNRHMVRDCPQNRGQDGGNAQPRPNPQNVAAAEPPKRNRFYALKGREE